MLNLSKHRFSTFIICDKFAVLIYVFIAFCTVFCSSKAQSANFISKRLIPLKNANNIYEIGRVIFSGNFSLHEEDLLRLINSRASERSTPQTIIAYFADQIEQNSAIPKQFKEGLSQSLKYINENIQIFSEEKAAADIENIRKYYNQNGFHDVIIYYSFIPDRDNNTNILTFHIIENTRRSMKKINYIGLDSLPPKILSQIESKKIILGTSYFNEFKIIAEANIINKYLLDVGYFYSQYSTPVISIGENYDSVSVSFYTGKRQKIGNIVFTDSLKKQTALARSMKVRMMDMHEDSWYSISKEISSENNFTGLGLFENVSIDTLNTTNDSTLNFEVKTIYRKQQEYGFSLFANRTVVDKTLNIGGELSYQHRNIFGAAQNFNPFIRFEMLDVSSAIYDMSKAQFEFQMGFNFLQPLLWRINETKIAGNMQLLFSQRTLNSELRLNTVSLPFKISIVLPRWTFINGASVDLSFERQAPENFANALIKAYSESSTAQDSLDVLETFYPFQKLNDFVNKQHPIFTSTILGATIIGDTRDNPFSPKSGYFLSFSADGSIVPHVNNITGMANYAKLHFLYSGFHSLNLQSVLAWKVRLGHIFWFDKENSYVPFERQFFAGGANSVRGWPSRMLRYLNGTDISGLSKNNRDFAEDFIGSSSIFEGSFEWRYMLAIPGRLNGTIGKQLENIGITTFVDYGNAYQWIFFTNGNKYTINYSLSDYIQGIAVAAGFGLRYELPIGPFRLDFAWRVYDPNAAKDKTIFTRSKALNGLQVQIGLGHAF